MSESTQDGNTALALREARPYVPSIAEIDVAWRIAESAGKSGLAKVKNPYEAHIRILAGMELGFSPTAALRAIYSVNGTPTISGAGMLALVRKSGKLADMKITGDTTQCTVWMKRSDTDEERSMTFTLQDAQRARLAGKDVWKAYPQRMLQWRAISWLCNDLFGDVIMGMKTHEEMGALNVDENGEIVGSEILVENPTPIQDTPRRQNKREPKDAEFEEIGDDAPWHTRRDKQEELLSIIIREGKGVVASDILPKIDPSASRWSDLGMDWDETLKAVRKVITELNQPPNKTNKKPPQQPNNESTLLEITGWLWDHFNMSPAGAMSAIGTGELKDYDGKPAGEFKADFLDAAKRHRTPVIVNRAHYDGKMVTFPDAPIPVRIYGRSTKFKEMVGDLYYQDNGIEDWTKRDDPYDIGALKIEWEPADSGKYNVVVNAEPVTDIPF